MQRTWAICCPVINYSPPPTCLSTKTRFLPPEQFLLACLSSSIPLNEEYYSLLQTSQRTKHHAYWSWCTSNSGVLALIRGSKLRNFLGCRRGSFLEPWTGGEESKWLLTGTLIIKVSRIFSWKLTIACLVLLLMVIQLLSFGVVVLYYYMCARSLSIGAAH